MQLNIGSLLEPGWPERRHEVVAWLDRLEPDIVCLQEAWQSDESPNTAAWVAEQASADWQVAFGGASFDPGLWPDESLSFGSAILSRWPIDQCSYHRLPTGPDGSPFVVGVPWELFHAQTAGLDVFSTHLSAAPTDGMHRRVQVAEIDRYVREIRGDRDDLAGFGTKRESMPSILCGDFNAEPDSDEIRFMSSLTALDGRTTFWQDTWRLAGDGGQGLTQDWRTNPIAADMNVHPKRIDYVFVGDPFQRKGNAGRVLATEVVCDKSLTGVIASDHFGLCVDIVWPQRPDTS